MENNILLNWKFWISFYLYLSYSLCLLDLLESSMRCGIKVFLIKILTKHDFDDEIEDNEIFIETSYVDHIAQSICILLFVSSVLAMLASKDIKIFTTEHIFLCLIGALFSIYFHLELAKAIFNKISTAFKVFIPASISTSFILFYLIALKSSTLFSLCTYPGEIIYKSFLVPLVPWVTIFLPMALRFTGTPIFCLKIPVLFLCKLIEMILLPLKIIRNLKILIVSRLAKDTNRQMNYESINLNDKSNQKHIDRANSFDNGVIYCGKLLSKDTCICAFCRKTKKLGIKLDPLPFETIQEPFIVCLDCHLEKTSLIYGVSKEKALQLHKIKLGKSRAL